jgi:selenocysteine lyase/cysteine desulfurase
MDSQFPHAENLIYLNHAAVGPWPQCTYDAVERFARENLERGAQHYPQWLQTETSLRERLQWLINAKSTEGIALLKNTSEALSVIAYGLDWQPGDNVVLAGQEFPSNRIVWESLGRLGVEIRVVDLPGFDNPEAALIEATNHRTRLLTSSSVNYASGLKMDLERLGRHCARNGILFCVDGIQSLGAFPFDVEAVQADFVVADGHKWMLGPEGLALFYCRPELLETLTLHQYGWHMIERAGDYDRADWQPASSARRFECGSPNMLGIHALHASLGLLQKIGIGEISIKIVDNISYLIEKSKEIKGTIIQSPVAPNRRAGIFNIKLAGRDNIALHRELTRQHVICAYRGGGIRFSPHFYSTEAQLGQALEILKQSALKADE